MTAKEVEERRVMSQIADHLAAGDAARKPPTLALAQPGDEGTGKETPRPATAKQKLPCIICGESGDIWKHLNADCFHCMSCNGTFTAADVREYLARWRQYMEA